MLRLFVLLITLAVSSMSWAQEISLRNSTDTCTNSIEGAVRYNASSKNFEGCNGSAWANLNSSSSVTISTSLPNCRTILNAYGSSVASSGTYTIDPDGDGSVAAFDVYCNMTDQGGGWTLVAYHQDGVTPAVQDISDGSTLGVLSNAQWQALKANYTSGMMFKDENDLISTMSKTKLDGSGNCISLTNSLVSAPYLAGYNAIWWYENSGCDGSGSDYTFITLDSQSGAGTSMFNEGSVTFDIWPYSATRSISEQNNLFYYIK